MTTTPRHSPRRFQRLLTLAIGLVALAGCAVSDGLQVGAAAPELAVESWVNTSAGATPTVSGNRGKHLFIEFFSMHCPFCRDAIPEMNDIARRYCCTELEILSVHVPLGDHDDTTAEVAHFAQKAQIPFPVGIDPMGVTLSHYEFGYLPHGVLIGPDGRVVWAGPMNGGNVEERIRAALGSGEMGSVASARVALPALEMASGLAPLDADVPATRSHSKCVDTGGAAHRCSVK